MDFFTLIERRRSVRAFQERPIEEEKVHRLLRAAQRAPSAGNLQALEVYATSRPEVKRALAQAAWDQMFIAQAPLVLVFFAYPARSAQKYGRRGETLYALQDATIAGVFVLLAAAALGLGIVWVGAFDEERVRRILDAPPGLRPVALLPVGYPAEEPPERPRRPLEDMVHWR